MSMLRWMSKLSCKGKIFGRLDGPSPGNGGGINFFEFGRIFL